MLANPPFQPDADGSDLVLLLSPFGPGHPDADAILAPLALHTNAGQRTDDPFFQSRHIAPHVGRAPVEIEHQVGHPLPGPVIGELSAAAGGVHWEEGLRSAPPAVRWCPMYKEEGARAARPARAPSRPEPPQFGPP